MNSLSSLEKVTAFITRGIAHSQELLVFRHPNGSIQLPAGTVEEGESAETAVRRETWEETGLAAVDIVTYLGARTQTLAPDERVILRRVTLLQQPAPDAPEVSQPFPSFLGLRRGLYVRQVSTAGEYTQVSYEEFDGPAHEFTVPSRSVLGWVESNALTSVVVRHFFHLTPTEPTPDAWVQSAEEWEHRFELYWLPLTASQIAGLIPSQAAWLTEYAAQLAQQ